MARLNWSSDTTTVAVFPPPGFSLDGFVEPQIGIFRGEGEDGHIRDFKASNKVFNENIVLAESARARSGCQKVDNYLIGFPLALDVIQEGARGQDKGQTLFAGGVPPACFEDALICGWMGFGVDTRAPEHGGNGLGPQFSHGGDQQGDPRVGERNLFT